MGSTFARQKVLIYRYEDTKNKKAGQITGKICYLFPLLGIRLFLFGGFPGNSVEFKQIFRLLEIQKHPISRY